MVPAAAAEVQTALEAVKSGGVTTVDVAAAVGDEVRRRGTVPAAEVDKIVAALRKEAPAAAGTHVPPVPHVIQTDAGPLQLVRPTPDQVAGVSRYAPMGIRKLRYDDADVYGFVFQTGPHELTGLKFQLGVGATAMINDMALAVVEASKTTHLPLQPFISHKLRPKAAIGRLATHFLVQGSQVFVVKAPLDDREPVWKQDTGVTPVVHVVGQPRRSARHVRSRLGRHLVDFQVRQRHAPWHGSAARHLRCRIGLFLRAEQDDRMALRFVGVNRPDAAGESGSLADSWDHITMKRLAGRFELSRGDSHGADHGIHSDTSSSVRRRRED
jgi:hypothetical protein